MSKKIISENNNNNILFRMRSDLESAPTTARQESARKIIAGSVDLIHARMRSGERIADIHPIINSRLERENRPKITLRTFSKYLSEARNLAGLPKIKNSGPKAVGNVQFQPKTASPAETTKPKQSSLQIKSDTSSDFRTDPDDF